MGTRVSVNSHHTSLTGTRYTTCSNTSTENCGLSQESGRSTIHGGLNPRKGYWKRIFRNSWIRRQKSLDSNWSGRLNCPVPDRNLTKWGKLYDGVFSHSQLTSLLKKYYGLGLFYSGRL